MKLSISWRLTCFCLLVLCLETDNREGKKASPVAHQHLVVPILSVSSKSESKVFARKRVLVEQCIINEDKARLTGTRIYIILLLESHGNGDGVAVKLWCLVEF